VHQFIQTLSQQESLQRVAGTLEKYLLDKINERAARTTLWFLEPEKLEIPELCFSDILLELDTPLIAEQLSLVDFQIYKEIEPTELLRQAWTKPKTKHKSPNVVALINRSTRLSFWVATMIVSQEKSSGRVKMIEKFVDIAKHLEKISNFNTLMGILAGINLSPIHRMKKNLQENSSCQS